MSMLTGKEIDSKITGIKKSAANLRDNIQTVLIHTAAHAYAHGDVTRFDKLIAATGGIDRKAIMCWISEYGFASFKRDDDATAFVGKFNLNKTMRGKADFANGEEVIAYLLEQPTWFDVKAVVKPKTILDVNKRLTSLTKALQEAEVGTVAIDLESALRALENLTLLVASANARISDAACEAHARDSKSAEEAQADAVRAAQKIAEIQAAQNANVTH